MCVEPIFPFFFQPRVVLFSVVFFSSTGPGNGWPPFPFRAKARVCKLAAEMFVALVAFEIEYRRGVVNRISFARLIYFNIRLPWFSQALFKIYNELAIIILFVPLLLFNWIVRTYDT